MDAQTVNLRDGYFTHTNRRLYVRRHSDSHSSRQFRYQPDPIASCDNTVDSSPNSRIPIRSVIGGNVRKKVMMLLCIVA